MVKLATVEVLDEIKDLHNGLKMAMDNLIRSKNYSEAERILRQVDLRMTNLINSTKPSR